MAAPVTIASDTLPTAPNTSYIVWETSTAGVDAATTNVLTPPIPVASYGRVTARTGNAGTAEIEWEVIGT
jgi:hypothetical protein